MWRGENEVFSVIPKHSLNQCEAGNAAMKVTVCFSGVRVVVPCGDGNGSVRDLMLLAASRYKKATGKASDYWVTVLSLQSSDGGLLDPDDRLSDVADDREQIIAVFEERDGRAALGRGGDGTSASSDGTRSPVQYTNGEQHQYSAFSRVDVEVTGEDLVNGCMLQVRRGSEPTLTQACAALPPFAPPPLRSDASKRWSAAPIIDDDIQASSTPIKNTSLEQLTPPPAGERQEASGDEREPTSAFSRFARDSHRLSMQFGGNGDAMWRWADAAGRLQDADLHERRWEPVGANPSPEGSGDDGGDLSPPSQHNGQHYDQHDQRHDQRHDQQARLVVLTDVSGPLGMHVVPDCDGSGRDSGLLVQRVEPGSAAQRDGRVAVGDRIVQINGHSLRNISFQRAQEIFLSAMSAGQLRLVVEPGTSPAGSGSGSGSGGSRVATVIPTKKPVIPPALSSRTQSAIQTSNTRKLGRRLTVSLVKGAAGLGFSVTTRDNPAGGRAPVYVKNILAQGAAVEDGRLRPGDRLLEIDGQPMAGLSQQQVVQTLRSVPPGHSVQLVISRHEQDETSTAAAAASAGKKEEDGPRLPRPLPPEQREEEESEPTYDKEILVFDIPVHDSERAGLGISVKGKTTAGRSGPLDVGIYIKSVIHGGAASKDGRLQRDDQLIDVNASPLLGLSNTDAMETLRRAMCQEGPKPGVISLTVARRPDLPGGPTTASGRASVASMLSNSSGELLSGWRSGSGDRSGFSEDSQVTVVARQPPPPPVPARHDRLQPARANIRNESYYRATHDTWNASGIQHHLLDTTGDTTGSGGPGGGGVGGGGGGHGVPGRQQVAADSPAPTAGSGSGTADCAYASQTSLEHAGVGFTRDQPGRRSMSEKRHASKDAKTTDTYQRTKRAREEREAQRRQIEAELRLQEASERRRVAEVVGPSLGLKKSSSLESLQTMVHELGLAEDGGPRGASTAARGRGCNESFRAAVDRSYEAPLGAIRDRMETLGLEADEGYVAYLVDEEAGGGGFSRDLAARQSSMSSGVVEDKKGKRRSGLLKGLGSMFKFGSKQRRPEETEPVPPVRTTSSEHHQHQYQQHQHQQQQQRVTHAPPSQGQPAGPAPPVTSAPPSAGGSQERAPSRADRMAQLRHEHQRRHAGRQGVYVTEAAEERAEQQLRQVNPGKPVGPPGHLSDQLNNNIPTSAPEHPSGAAFVRGAQGARSSEYFRNPRPAPIGDRPRSAHHGVGPPPHSWVGEDPSGGRSGMGPHPNQHGSAAVPSGGGDPAEPRAHPRGYRVVSPAEWQQPGATYDASDPRGYPGGPTGPRAYSGNQSGPHGYPHGNQSGHHGYPGNQSAPHGYPSNQSGPHGYPSDKSAPHGYPSNHGNQPEPYGYPGGNQSGPHGYHSTTAGQRGYPAGQSDVRAHPGEPWPPPGGSGGPWVYPAPAPIPISAPGQPSVGGSSGVSGVVGGGGGGGGGGARRPSAVGLVEQGGRRAPPPPPEPAPEQDRRAERQRYGHYANYEQIRHHLSRQQQQYHSQRGRRPADAPAADRPVSAYYEHEAAAAAAAAARAGGGGGEHSLPRRHERSRSGPAIGPPGVGAPPQSGDPRLRPAPVGLPHQHQHPQHHQHQQHQQSHHQQHHQHQHQQQQAWRRPGPPQHVSAAAGSHV